MASSTDTAMAVSIALMIEEEHKSLTPSMVKMEEEEEEEEEEKLPSIMDIPQATPAARPSEEATTSSHPSPSPPAKVRGEGVKAEEPPAPAQPPIEERRSKHEPGLRVLEWAWLVHSGKRWQYFGRSLHQRFYAAFPTATRLSQHELALVHYKYAAMDDEAARQQLLEEGAPLWKNQVSGGGGAKSRPLRVLPVRRQTEEEKRAARAARECRRRVARENLRADRLNFEAIARGLAEAGARVGAPQTYPDLQLSVTVVGGGTVA